MPRINVEGYDNFCQTIANLEEKSMNSIYVLFSGSKDSTGQSWCPDCVAAEPVIEKVINDVTDPIHFVYVSVGTREQWKDPMSSFRKDSKLRLQRVPTFLRWGKPQRLEEGECTNQDLVKMLIEEEED